MAEFVAVCVSEKKGIRKKEVPQIDVRIDHGIVGDAHAGAWHRQISLLADESIDTMRSFGLTLTPGAFIIRRTGKLLRIRAERSF